MVGRTYRPVDLKGVCEGATLKALTQHQLEDVASLDVLLHKGHIVQEALACHIGCLRCLRPRVQRQ